MIILLIYHLSAESISNEPTMFFSNSKQFDLTNQFSPTNPFSPSNKFAPRSEAIEIETPSESPKATPSASPYPTPSHSIKFSASSEFTPDPTTTPMPTNTPTATPVPTRSYYFAPRDPFENSGISLSFSVFSLVVCAITGIVVFIFVVFYFAPAFTEEFLPLLL